LPRGRHGLAREEVRASQRERLIRAMLRCVASDGYAATSIPRVAALARVSPNTFYALFDDKAGCFLAGIDEQAGVLLGEIVRAAEGRDWLEGLRASVRVYLAWWRDRPEETWAYTVELPAAGERAAAQRRRTYARFEALFEASAAHARAQRPELAEVSPLAVRMLVAGLTEVVADEVRAGRLDRLGELEDALVDVIVHTLAPR
jgi:AcrR family transcriptional regulator